MGSWCSRCCKSCCGDGDEVSVHSHLVDKERVTTVRRISSVGISVVGADGVEREIPRHTSILQSYNGVDVPWTSTPLSIQPGVTKEEVASRIKALPTIAEGTPTPKRKNRGWKKAFSKGDSTSSERKSDDKTKNKTAGDLQLSLFKNVSDQNDVSYSQEEIGARPTQQNDPAWRPLRRPSYCSSPNLFAMKISDKSSQHLMSLAEYSQPEAADTGDNRSSWLQSQSLERVSIEEEEESEASKLAKQYGLRLSLYVENDALSHKEANAVKIEPLKFWPERSYGTVDVIVSINPLQKLLTVTVDGMRGLSGIGPQRQSYPVVFKISLLNDKKSAKTGRKLARTSSPKVNQTFIFFLKDVNSRGFKVSVFNADFLGRHDAIGHALFNLTDATKDMMTYPLKLGRPSTIELCSAVIEVILTMKDTLELTVVRVLRTPQKYAQGRFYVKTSYFSLSKKTKERISPICCLDGDSLTFDHLAKLKIDTSGQKHSYVMLSLKMCNSKFTFRTNDKTIGRVYFGPCFYYEDGSLTPWGKVLLRREEFAGSFQMYL
ncbi:Hypothetical protein NTJ_07375 [Nesidiocoris tenuis]|uniref:C2 domain-containing protein n=1 Tax=Nesidiocoris tenuis TaxID=355587 RepID=A0ABN7ARK3_9HEMI|nr:Hypothetical protein NTJ_07375 [Nesidiocoris tenuis]